MSQYREGKGGVLYDSGTGTLSTDMSIGEMPKLHVEALFAKPRFFECPHAPGSGYDLLRDRTSPQQVWTETLIDEEVR